MVDKYGIEVRFKSEMTEVDADAGTVVITDNAAGGQESLHNDLLHVVPPQSSPDWLKRTPLADPANPADYVDVDKQTLQQKRYPESSPWATPGGPRIRRPEP